MYGLPQAGSLGHDLLKERLNKEGYFQSKTVSGLWKHKTRDIKFVLVVIYVQVGSNWIYCLQYCIGGSRSQGNLWSDLSGGSDSHVL